MQTKEKKGKFQPVKPSTERLVSLDVFRGLTIMGMILVNNPGNGSHVYPPLRHAEWHGCNFTDLIFPFFLFIVGVAMSFSFAKRAAQADSPAPLIKQVIRRTLILFALGLFLNWFPFFDIAHGRIPGVLQRIAVCYFFAAWIIMRLKPGAQWMVTFLLMAIHWIGLTWIPVPGYGAGVLEPQGNLCGYIDGILLKGHTWPHAPAPGFDPEGIFSTITALATTMFGVFTGNWLRSERGKETKLAGLFVAANVGMVTGYILTIWMPMNKNMWSVSYLFFTAGLALHFLAMCFWLIDLKGIRSITVPFVIFGSNAIFVYMLSSAAAKLMVVIKLQSSAHSISLKAWLFQNIFKSWAGEMNGSLIFAITYVLIWLGVTYLLYRKKIFIKI